MSNSTKRALIRSSLTELFCDQTKAITFITSDGVDFHILDAFICPLCMNIINVEDKDKITLEDVPPESVGGKPILVTCADCNNTLGGRVDNYLYNELLVYHFLHIAEEGCLTGSCTTCEEKATFGVGNELVCEHLLLVLCVDLCVFHVHHCSIAGRIWVRRVLKSLSRKLL